MSAKLLSVESYLKSLSSRADLGVLEGLLKDSDIQFADVRELCSFDQNHYCRNLISSGAWYDMLLLCWKPGQESSIHDHVGSSCAFKILTGVSTETIYRKLGQTRNGVGLVESIGSMKYPPGELCLAQDEAIHRISNDSSDTDLVTLHIYSPQLHMNYYETEDGYAGGYQPQEILAKRVGEISLTR